MQKKAFTNWVNSHLMKVSRFVIVGLSVSLETIHALLSKCYGSLIIILCQRKFVCLRPVAPLVTSSLVLQFSGGLLMSSLFAHYSLLALSSDSQKTEPLVVLEVGRVRGHTL